MKTLFLSLKKTALYTLSICCFTSCMPSISDILSKSDTQWQGEDSKHFRFYFEKDAYNKHERDSLQQVIEQNYDVVLNKLQEKPRDGEILTHFIVRTPRSYALLTRNQNLSSWHHLNFFSTSSLINNYMMTMASHPENEAITKSELAYLLINKRWRWQSSCNCDNALGAFVNDSWRGYNLHELSAFLLKNHIDFWHNEVFRFSNINLETPLYASLLKFVIEKYDQETFRYVCSHQFTLEPEKSIFVKEWEQMLRERYLSSPALDTISYFTKIR